MGRRTLEPGQYVQTGQTISYLVRNKDKWITANYKETQIANIYIGQQVRIKVDAVPGKIFHGEVTAISEATGSKYSLVPTDNSAGNFVKVQQRIPVRIDLEDVSPEENGTVESRDDGGNRSFTQMITMKELEAPVRQWVPDWLGLISIFIVILPVYYAQWLVYRQYAGSVEHAGY